MFNCSIVVKHRVGNYRLYRSLSFNDFQLLSVDMTLFSFDCRPPQCSWELDLSMQFLKSGHRIGIQNMHSAPKLETCMEILTLICCPTIHACMYAYMVHSQQKSLSVVLQGQIVFSTFVLALSVGSACCRLITCGQLLRRRAIETDPASAHAHLPGRSSEVTGRSMNA